MAPVAAMLADQRLTVAERERFAALLLAAEYHGKPSWQSASFWLTVVAVLCTAVVAGLLTVKGNAAAAAVAAALTVLGAGLQTIRNSGDKREDARIAAQKLESALTPATLAPAPGDPAPVAAPVVCSVCGGSRRVFFPGATGKVAGEKPCPNCTDPEP